VFLDLLMNMCQMRWAYYKDSDVWDSMEVLGDVDLRVLEGFVGIELNRVQRDTG
jgi:hypothetical protein